MEFRNATSIYLQIADTICEYILSHKWKAGEKIPSVRELAVLMEVNANTIMRTYDYLVRENIISNRRGIGFYVNEDAITHITGQRRVRFMEQELPIIFKNMQWLGISMQDMEQLYNQYNTQENEKIQQ